MSGGTLEIVMDDDAKDDIVSSRPLVLTGANSSVLVDAHIVEPRFFTVTLNGPVTGGTLNKLGPATLILNGANAYSKTNIYAGELQGSANAINGDVTFFGPSVLHFVDTKRAEEFAGSISGPGSVVKRASPDSHCRARTPTLAALLLVMVFFLERRTACKGKSQTIGKSNSGRISMEPMQAT